jgi:pyridoxal 5'-phosphate synthase glutaminase subunit Pdx2
VTSPTIGVFALQGDVREHLQALTHLGVTALSVRRPAELEACDGLVIPGGESTTMAKLARTFELFEPLQKRIRGGMPTFGTCAGMIMLADRIEDGTADQETLGGLDITVRRSTSRCTRSSSGRRGWSAWGRTSRCSPGWAAAVRSSPRPRVGSSRSARAT